MLFYTTYVITSVQEWNVFPTIFSATALDIEFITQVEQLQVHGTQEVVDLLYTVNKLENKFNI